MWCNIYVWKKENYFKWYRLIHRNALLSILKTNDCKVSKVSFLNDVSAWIWIASANQFNIFSFERPLRSDLLLVFKYLTNIRNVQDFIISKAVNIGGTRKIPILYYCLTGVGYRRNPFHTWFLWFTGVERPVNIQSLVSSTTDAYCTWGNLSACYVLDTYV